MNADDTFLRALTGDDTEQTITLVRDLPGARRRGVGGDHDARADRAVVRHDHRARPARGRRRIRGRHRRGHDPPRGARELRGADRALVHLVVRRRRSRTRARPPRAAGEAETRLIVQHDRLRPHRLVQYGGGWEQNLVALAAVVGRRGGTGCLGAGARRAVGADARAPAARRAVDRRARGRRVERVGERGRARDLVVDPLGRRDDRRRRPGRRPVPHRGAAARDRGHGGVPRRRPGPPARLHVGCGRTRTAATPRRGGRCDVPRDRARHRGVGSAHRPVGHRRPGRVLPAGVGVRARGARPPARATAAPPTAGAEASN